MSKKGSFWTLHIREVVLSLSSSHSKVERLKSQVSIYWRRKENNNKSGWNEIELKEEIGIKHRVYSTWLWSSNPLLCLIQALIAPSSGRLLKFIVLQFFYCIQYPRYLDVWDFLVLSKENFVLSIFGNSRRTIWVIFHIKSGVSMPIPTAALLGSLVGKWL